MTPLHLLRRTTTLAGLLLTLLLTGCGQYTLMGKVISGEVSEVSFVAADDPRLAVPGLAEVQLSVLRDPETPKRAIAGSTTTDELGLFEMPIDGIGAGWMIEKWLLRAERHGYQTNATMVSLPASPRRTHVLITIRRGSGSTIPEPENLMQEMDRFK